MNKLEVCIEIPKDQVTKNDTVWKLTRTEIKNSNNPEFLQKATNVRIMIPVKTITEAQDTFFDSMFKYSLGPKDMFFFEPGIVYLDGNPLVRISFNGNLNDVWGKDLNDWQSHTTIPEDEVEEFLSSHLTT